MNIQKFEDLDIWKVGLEIGNSIYNLTKKREIYIDMIMRNQMRRAAISISSNIAEGFERDSNKDFVRFLRISMGSLSELKTQLYLCEKQNYITLVEIQTLLDEMEILSKRMGKLIQYLRHNDYKKETNNQKLKTI